MHPQTPHTTNMLSTLVTLLPLIAAQNPLFQINSRSTSPLFRAILRNYDDFDLIIHVENTTETIVNDFLAEYHVLTTIFNHDFDIPVTRPGSLQCLHLILFTDPLTFSRFSSNHNNIYSKDVIMFLCKENSFLSFQENYFRIPHLSRSGLVAVVRFDSGGISVYSMCFYCGGSTGRLLLRQRLEFSQLRENPVRLAPKKFDNLNEHVIRVVYIDYFPYVWCVVKSNGVCEEAIGSEYELLKTVSGKMNFTYELIEAPNRSYDALINGLVSGQYDMAIGGISITNSRREILQFSIVLRFEDLAFMFVYKRPFRLKIFYFSGVFNLKFWASKAVGVFSLATIVYFVAKYFNDKVHLTYDRITQVLTQLYSGSPIPLYVIFRSFPTPVSSNPSN